VWRHLPQVGGVQSALRVPVPGPRFCSSVSSDLPLLVLEIDTYFEAASRKQVSR